MPTIDMTRSPTSPTCTFTHNGKWFALPATLALEWRKLGIHSSGEIIEHAIGEGYLWAYPDPHSTILCLHAPI